MNTISILSLSILAAFSPMAAFGQLPGPSLTPPAGAPAPQFKTLAQVEARTPLSSGQPGVAINGAGTITISQPGSYYLTGNVSIGTGSAHGISITADNVTLDLNGFVLSCTAAAGGHAVTCDGRKGTRILNGSITSGTTVSGSTFTPAGWDRGVSADSAPDTTVSGLIIRGVRTDGIFTASDSTLVERCTINICAGVGARAHSVRDTTVRGAGGPAAIMSSTLKDSGNMENCYAENVSATGQGIFAPDATVINSRGISVGAEGIHALTVLNSRGESGTGLGIRADIATGCYAASTSGNGMQIAGTATHCRGRATVTAISAGIAIGCTTFSGAVNSTQKHLGTP